MAAPIRGVLVNGARNLSRLASHYAPPADELPPLIAAYVTSLRDRSAASLK